MLPLSYPFNCKYFIDFCMEVPIYEKIFISAFIFLASSETKSCLFSINALQGFFQVHTCTYIRCNVVLKTISLYILYKKERLKNLHLSLFCQYQTYFCNIFPKHFSIIIFLQHTRVELLSFLFQKFV